MVNRLLFGEKINRCMCSSIQYIMLNIFMISYTVYITINSIIITKTILVFITDKLRTELKLRTNNVIHIINMN